MTKSDKEEILETVNVGFQLMQGELNEVKTGFQLMQGELNEVKGDLNGVKTNLHLMSRELKEVKDDVKGLHVKVDSLTTAVDGLAKRHLDFESELAAERMGRERLEEKVDLLLK